MFFFFFFETSCYPLITIQLFFCQVINTWFTYQFKFVCILRSQISFFIIVLLVQTIINKGIHIDE
jgi:hypothetical protein